MHTFVTGFATVVPEVALRVDEMICVPSSPSCDGYRDVAVIHDVAGAPAARDAEKAR